MDRLFTANAYRHGLERRLCLTEKYDDAEKIKVLKERKVAGSSGPKSRRCDRPNAQSVKAMSASYKSSFVYPGLVRLSTLYLLIIMYMYRWSVAQKSIKE